MTRAIGYGLVVVAVLCGGGALLVGAGDATAPVPVSVRPAGSGLPAEAQGAVSAALGRGDRAFHVRAGRASNERHGFTAAFGARGVRLRADAGGAAALRLDGIGRAGALLAAGASRPSAHGNRVEYRRGLGVTEWFVNGPLGLEQGFDLARRPAGGDAPLTLQLGGDVRARLDDDRLGAVLTGTGLAYRGLWARDARGRDLRAWLEAPRDGGLAIRVDDRDAAYPLRVDPFFQRAHLTATPGAVNDRMGESVAVSGDTIVVGAPDDDINAQVDRGSAYVFVKPPTGWADATQTARLRASDGAAGDQFGEAVAIDGNTVVVGAPDKPAVYVFLKPAAGWVDKQQNAKLTTNPAVPDWADFGHSVAIDNNVVVVGAQYSDAGGASNEGAAYVYERPSGGWASRTQSATLVNFYGEQEDRMGVSVGISGSVVVAGAWGDDVDAAFDGQGSISVFNRPAATWDILNGGIEYHEAQLFMPDGSGDEELGWSVAIDGNTVVGGAPWADISGRVRQGALYVFQGGGVDWFPKVKLTADDGAGSDLLGWSVGISGNRIVGGAMGDDQFRGAAYVFENPGTGWENATQRAKIIASDRAANDNFAFATAISGGTVVSGAQTDKVGANAQQGSAYAFTLAPSAPVVSGPANAIAGATANYTAAVADGGNGGVADIRWSVAGLPDQHGAGASYQFPAPGTYTLHVVATDAAGNASPEGTLTVEVGAVPPVDADGDGVLNTTDCDDANAGRYPGAPDVPGNGIDEDCDNADAVVKLDPAVANKWGYAKRFSIVISLKVKDVPAGATVQVRCSGPRRHGTGCPFVTRKYKPKDRVRTVKLSGPFEDHKLWVKTVVEIRITSPGTIGKVVRYKISSNKVPPAKTLCLPPGAPKPERCG